MYIEAKFGGLGVTLGDENGDILSANMIGVYHAPSAHTCVYTKVGTCVPMKEDGFK